MFLSLVLVACGSNGDNSNDMATNDEAESVSANENNNETESVSTNDSNNNESEEVKVNEDGIEIPHLIPEDIYIPEDAEVDIFDDDVESAGYGFMTDESFDDLKVKYHQYFKDHEDADELEIDEKSADEYMYDDIIYAITTDKETLQVQVTDSDDFRIVNLNAVKMQ